MFEPHLLKDHNDITIFKCAASPWGKPLMVTYFFQVDNIFIDTGNSHTVQGQVKGYLKNLSSERDWKVYNTHLHEDHCGNNRLFQDILGAPIVAPEPEGKNNFDEVTWLYRLWWGKPKLFSYRQLTADEIKTDRGRTLEVIKTPGHSPYHISLYLKEDKILFPGDAITFATKKVYSLPDEDFYESITALKKLRDFITDDMTVISSHFAVLPNPREAITKRIEYMESVVEKTDLLTSRKVTDYRAIAREIFGKAPKQDILFRPRMTREQSIRSIVERKR